tara:strand:- start:2 stop:814 length:813 start_codon:yes stop_codon:yes gene_type:complete
MSLRLSNNKTTLHESIYRNTKLAFDKVIIQENILFLEEPVKKILEIDQNLYDANVWMAKILYTKGNNLSLDNDYKALEYINRAISISPSSQEAYRVGLKITNNINLINEKFLLCNQYNNSMLGGFLPSQYNNFFEGNNLQNMGVIIDKTENIQKVYTNYGIKFDQFNEYEFIFDNHQNFNQFSIILGMLPGISLEFEDILLNSNNTSIKISKSQYDIFPKNGYLIDNNKLIFVGMTDELININFGKEIKNIESVILKLKFKKLQINNICN